MQPTVETLQGEVLALRCHIAALMEVMSLSSQMRFRAKLETSLQVMRPAQPGGTRDGFERVTNSLAVKRLTQLDKGLGATHGG